MLHGVTAFSGVTLTASYDSTCNEHLTLEYATASGVVNHTACRTITAGPAYLVTTTGQVNLFAGERITLQPGFQVQTGGQLRATIDPSLKP